MFVHYRTAGIFLKKRDYKDDDQFFIVFTKDFGKIEILGKSIRKITSKLRPGADIFFLSEIEFIQGKNYKILTDAIVIEKFKKIRNNFKKLAISHRIANLIDKIISARERDGRIWKLINETFDILNNSSASVNLLLIYFYFFWNSVSILGYKPELYNCFFCKEKMKSDTIYFNSMHGGVVCLNCFNKDAQKNNYHKIDSNVLKILRIIIKEDWDIILKLKISPIHQKKLGIISKDFISFIPILNS